MDVITALTLDIDKRSEVGRAFHNLGRREK